MPGRVAFFLLVLPLVVDDDRDTPGAMAGSVKICLIFALVAASALGGCRKPCDGITPSADAKRMGFVLDGGRVCKEGKQVADVDYPDDSAGALPGKYKGALDKAGWKTDTTSHGDVILATRADDTLFIVTGKKSKQRRVPFAVVRYCSADYCRKSLTRLFTAMKKY